MSRTLRQCPRRLPCVRNRSERRRRLLPLRPRNLLNGGPVDLASRTPPGMVRMLRVIVREASVSNLPDSVAMVCASAAVIEANRLRTLPAQLVQGDSRDPPHRRRVGIADEILQHRDAQSTITDAMLDRVDFKGETQPKYNKSLKLADCSDIRGTWIDGRFHECLRR